MAQSAGVAIGFVFRGGAALLKASVVEPHRLDVAGLDRSDTLFEDREAELFVAHVDALSRVLGSDPDVSRISLPGAMSAFDVCIGIDYSGAETATSRLKELQGYVAKPGGVPEAVRTPAIAAFQATGSKNPQSAPRYWTRNEIAQWLIARARDGVQYIAGIDHGFSFPANYFTRYHIASWPQFLDDFIRHWPTDRDHVYVDFVRDGNLARHSEAPPPGSRVGSNKEFRLCERWTSSAKSVFQFDVQGSVAKSTHAGMPWLKRIRDEVGDSVHFWPFDGWQPPAGKSVIAEVYPSIFRNRYPKEKRKADEHDAYAVARWLSETAARGALDRYFSPPLTVEERRVAGLEGWILGIL